MDGRGGLGVLAVVCASGASCGRLRFDEIPTVVGDSAVPDATATVYHDMTDPASWSTFDATTVNPGAHGFVGAAFDGRYVYFVPYNNGGSNGIVTRYDTQATFTAGASWATFDATTVNPGAKGFAGAAFDGHYIYFIPNLNGATNSIVARYDTQATFTAGASWNTFDTTTVSSAIRGFQGAAFDGRYVYFAPWNNAASDGVAPRYDTKAPFTATAAWSSFDAATANAGAKGFFGAAFDGRYVYYVPNYNGTFDGIATRYDTHGTFSSGAAWSTFDATTVDAGANNFGGAVFDGNYVYYVPGFSGLITRYNVRAPFTASASWSVFDVATVSSSAKGFFGGAFDGRYVYYVPNYNGTFDGVVARYDSLASFTAAASWSTFDTTTVNSAAKGFHGAAFDGRYLYLVPSSGGMVARFDAKTPPSLPVGSFF